MKCPQSDPKTIWKKIQKDKQIDLFTVFSTFDMDKLGRYGYAKSQNFTGVCVVGAQTCTPPYKRLQNLATLRCIFTSFQQITFKFGNFINFKALFSVVSTDFPELVHVKSWKNSWKGLFTAYYIMALFFFVYKTPVQLTYSLWRNVITMLRDYVTKVNRFIELGLPEVYVTLSVRKYYWQLYWYWNMSPDFYWDKNHAG